LATDLNQSVERFRGSKKIKAVVIFAEFLKYSASI